MRLLAASCFLATLAVIIAAFLLAGWAIAA